MILRLFAKHKPDVSRVSKLQLQFTYFSVVVHIYKLIDIYDMIDIFDLISNRFSPFSAVPFHTPTLYIAG